MKAPSQDPVFRFFKKAKGVSRKPLSLKLHFWKRSGFWYQHSVGLRTLQAEALGLHSHPWTGWTQKRPSHQRHSRKASAGDDRVAAVPAKPEGRHEGGEVQGTTDPGGLLPRALSRAPFSRVSHAEVPAQG